MTRKPKVYFPGRKFPSISVTGRECQLNCPHCMGKYLRQMMDGSGDLLSLVEKLVEKGIEGILISGGCSAEGKVPIDWNEVKRIKEEFEIKINVHVGLISEKEVKLIADSEVDVVSFDFIPKEEVLFRIYGKKMPPDWATSVLKSFEREGISYAPHITIGLDWGNVWWEYDAIEKLKERSFEVLVLNVLIPTKGTKMEKVPIVPLEEFSKVLGRAKDLGVEISLGCMRPRRRGYEEEAIRKGIDRIVLPPRKVKRNWKIIERCCVL